MADPAPVVTFLFTDIAESSSKWERDPEGAMAALEAHNGCVRRHVASGGGEVFKSLGDGLAAVFASPWSAVQAAVDVQASVTSELGPIVRIGVHSGPAVKHEGDYQGAAVNRAARIASLAHPGQTLVSATTFGLAADLLGRGLEWRHVGEVRLKGHDRREDLWQPDVAGAGRGFPPPLGAEPDHNLVALEREMLGRDRELQALSSLVLDGRRRLVTLLGFGGMGKTTLANRVAWTCLPEFEEVWWVGLEICRTEQHARAAIVASVGDGAAGGAALADSFGRSETLLVLDCCDALSGKLDAVGELLRARPGITVLATSRNVLGLPYEHVFELGGLDQTPGSSGVSEATRLFLDAAETAVGLRPTRAERGRVAELVSKLEGNPLAILLAAGRLRAMSLDELADRVIESPLRAVRSPHRGGRHESLRHVVETSMSLLGEGDREWTVRFSVFEGGFGLDDACAVFGDGETVEDAVQRLRESSLLTTESTARGMTLRQPDPVREFAREIGDASILEECRAAHARHYARRATDAREAYVRGAHQEAAELVAKHQGNLRAGFAYAVSTDDAPLVVTYVKGLARFTAEAGLQDEFEALASAGATAARSVGDSELVLEILGLRGLLARRAGRHDDARKSWEERARLASALDDPTMECDALGDLADLALLEGSLAEARAYYRRAKETAPRSQAADASVWLAVLQGRIALAEDDLDSVRESLDEIAAADVSPDHDFFRLRSMSELARAVGDDARARVAAAAMVRSACAMGHGPRAAQALWQALACFDERGESIAVAETLGALLRMPRRVDPGTWKRARLEAADRGLDPPATTSSAAFWSLAASVCEKLDGV